LLNKIWSRFVDKYNCKCMQKRWLAGLMTHQYKKLPVTKSVKNAAFKPASTVLQYHSKYHTRDMMIPNDSNSKQRVRNMVLAYYCSDTTRCVVIQLHTSINTWTRRKHTSLKLQTPSLYWTWQKWQASSIFTRSTFFEFILLPLPCFRRWLVNRWRCGVLISLPCHHHNG